MLFWIITGLALGIVVIVFFDAARDNPMGTTLLLSVALYFLWRSYSFLTGAYIDDRLLWKNLAATAALMILVGTIGSILARKKSGKH